MRIAVDARALCVPTFGIGRYTKEVLDRLIPAGDLEWFLYADRPMLIDYGEHANVTRRSFTGANRLLSLARTQWTFARWAASDHVDVFWSPRHHLPLALDHRIKTVVTVHDLVWRRYPTTMRLTNRWVERMLMPPSLGRASAVIAVSDATRRDIEHYFPSVGARVSVIPEAATKYKVVSSADGARYFFFVGTQEPRKNLPRLIQAFAAAQARGLGDCELAIAGAVGWQTSLPRLVASLGLEESVSLLGHINDETLHARMAGAIALCLPSLYEGFGLPALEAMQYGTPVIGSNVSSIPEIVGEGGILVDPLSVDQIAGAMLRMANDAGLRAQLSSLALAQSTKFSWDRAADDTLSVLKSVVDAP